MGAFVLLAYLPIGKLPDRKARSVAVETLVIRRVELPAPVAPLTLAGAWTLHAADRRFAGLSGLALDQGRFLAVSDLGAVVRFDRPSTALPKAEIQDLRIGPGKFGKKKTRDAESITRDPAGRGWWIGFERHHSLWLYDPSFRGVLDSVDLKRPDWGSNRGAEGVISDETGLLVLPENGQELMALRGRRLSREKLVAGADVADAARAPDGSAWLLLRSEGLNGISQAIAGLIRTRDGYRIGPAWPVPKDPFDNYEGMAIELLSDGRWRFWLVTDDGHRVMARNLLVALDYLPPGHNKSPATSTGLSKLQPVNAP